MSKFKKGDIIKYVNDSGAPYSFQSNGINWKLKLGDTVTIDDVITLTVPDGINAYRILEDDDNRNLNVPYMNECFEKVTPLKTISKDDLMDLIRITKSVSMVDEADIYESWKNSLKNNSK